MPTKRESQYNHAKTRFKERYNFKLTEQTERKFVCMIQESEALFIEKQSNRISKYEINYDGKIFIVIYDKKRKSIVTALPQGDEKC